MQKVVITAAARTAIGSFGGGLADIPGHVLGSHVVRAVLERSGVQAEQIDELIFGQVLTAGCGQNPARQAAIAAGLPHHVPSMTINKVCGSGLKSVQLAAQAIRDGEARIVVAGGQENMSLAPHLLPRSRRGVRLGDWALQDSMVLDGLWDAFNEIHMGITAENIAKKFDISRTQQDEFAAASQQKAEKAKAAGRFKEELVPVPVPQRKADPIPFDTDEFPRAGVTADSLAKLRPAFDRKAGTVTAGNASGLNDGAAAVLVMAADEAEKRGIPPLAEITASASSGVDPALMGTGPIPASKRCLEKAGWDVTDLDLIESNEAFASQAISVNRAMGWDADKVNVNGGAIALGHPIGASGCRILVTLLHELARREEKKGLATLCIGGGQGVALAVQRS